MEDTKQSPTLPSLIPTLEIKPAPNNRNGTPAWSIHHPLSNQYYKIGWLEFECLSRFSSSKTIHDLVASVNAQTSLDIDDEDVKNLLLFLEDKNLLAREHIDYQEGVEKPPLWKTILHKYLFISIPLVQPDHFLRATLPLIKPLLTKTFITVMMMILVAGLFYTLPRLDEFMGTFTSLFSLEGIALGLLIYAILKIIHEMAHAYCAAKYGVPVPHMGVAFILMYPILYTEVTAGWQMDSRRHRLNISLAGIIAELCVAAIAIWIWNFSVDGGIVHSLAFTTLIISVGGSLLINLNPLMRFDGYYIFSDLLQQDNLEQSAFFHAKSKLRSILFGQPFLSSEENKKFLIIFGFCLIIYRFFLYLGIAYLVYSLFPKPFGLIMAGIEIYWFIINPILREMQIWWNNRVLYFQSKHALISAALVIIALLTLIIPIQNSITLPAILHPRDMVSIYPPAPAFIQNLNITNNQSVMKGDVLAILTSKELDKNLNIINQKIKAVKQSKTGIISRSDIALSDIEDQLVLLQQERENILEKQNDLKIIAPFDGIITDLNSNIHNGRYINDSDLLFRLIAPENKSVTAYILEGDRRLITTQSSGFFRSSLDHNRYDVHIQSIEKNAVQTLSWPGLSSLYGGEIATHPPSNSSDELSPVRSYYAIRLNIPDDNGHQPQHIERGNIIIKANNYSYLSRFYNFIFKSLRQQAEIN